MKVDLSAWKHLYSLDAPATFVHLTVSRGAADSATAVDIRWRDMREQLQQRGAPTEDLVALDAVVTAPPSEGGPGSRYALCSQGRLLLDRLLVGDENGPELADHSPVPDLTPVLRDAARRVAFMVVEASRDGADMTLQEAGRVRRHRTVEGEEDALKKVRGGGWSHRRMQQHTEEVWRRNAAEVATTLDEEWRRSNARVLVLAGDVRAREKIRGNLSTALSAVLVEVDRNTRADGASGSAIEGTLAETLDELEDQERADALARLHVEDERHATVGLEATLGALRETRVGMVLLDPDAASARTVTALQGPPWVARVGAQDDLASPLADLPAHVALVRAAALTGAELLLLDHHQLPVEDGVAGLVRWDMPV
jgi:hypothetical protein